MSATTGASTSRRAVVVSTTVVIAVSGTALAAGPAAAHEPLVLASVTAEGGRGNGTSGTFGVALSADGSTVAFSSLATDLSAEDGDAEADVYVKTLATGVLRLASTSTSGRKASTFSVRPSLDAVGRRVAFLSTADDLHLDDTDGYADVFVKDLTSGELVLASADAAGVKGAASSGPPVLSSQGRHVAFTSRAALVPQDTDTAPDVYVKELDSGAVHLANRHVDGSGAEAGSYGIGTPSLSADGTRVAFDTDAALDPSDTDDAPDVYVKDLRSGELVLASSTAAGENTSGGSFRPSLSDDGVRVAFDSASSDLSPDDGRKDQDVYVKDLRSGALLLGSSSGSGIDGRATDASLSGDGRTVVFSADTAPGADGRAVPQTWAKDLDSAAETLVSVDASGRPADAVTIDPRVSADGSVVAFTTPAALSPADDNGWADVYVRSLREDDPPSDGEEPVLSLTATPEVLPAVRRAPVRITASATDVGSGLASLSVTLTDARGRVRGVLRQRVVAGQPRASLVRTVVLPGRVGRHALDGRDFTVLATATDVSGNTSDVHVHVVAPAGQGHRKSHAGGAGPGRIAADERLRTGETRDTDRHRSGGRGLLGPEPGPQHPGQP